MESEISTRVPGKEREVTPPANLKGPMLDGLDPVASVYGELEVEVALL